MIHQKVGLKKLGGQKRFRDYLNYENIEIAKINNGHGPAFGWYKQF